jgi:hypothetical protein
MSSHQRFSAALLLIAASVALGACGSNDPTGVRSVVGSKGIPVKPLSECTNGGGTGLHGDTIVEAIRGPSAARAAQPEKLVSCVNAQ